MIEFKHGDIVKLFSGDIGGIYEAYENYWLLIRYHGDDGLLCTADDVQELIETRSE